MLKPANVTVDFRAPGTTTLSSPSGPPAMMEVSRLSDRTVLKAGGESYVLGPDPTLQDFKDALPTLQDFKDALSYAERTQASELGRGLRALVRTMDLEEGAPLARASFEGAF